MPWGVKLIAVLLYLVAVLIFIVGLMTFFAPEAVQLAFSTAGIFSSVGKAVMIMFGILFLAIAVLYVFVGRDLWRGKSWARIAALIIYGIGVLQYLVMLITGDFASLFFLLISGVVFCYLMFSHQVKIAFASKSLKRK